MSFGKVAGIGFIALGLFMFAIGGDPVASYSFMILANLWIAADYVVDCICTCGEDGDAVDGTESKG